MTCPDGPWSLGVLSDSFGISRCFRVLAVNDHCTCENHCLIAMTSLKAPELPRRLDAPRRIFG